MLRKLVEKSKGLAKPPRSDPDYKTPLPDFKGQRRDPIKLQPGLPESKQTAEMRYRKTPYHKMHPREIRVKTTISLLGYTAWFVSVFMFIAYRLSSDDLDTLEKEARQEIEIREKIKKQFISQENKQDHL